MSVLVARRSLGQLLRQGWTEIPEVIASTGLALFGVGCGVYACYKYVKTDGDNRRYKKVFVIMRPDDPRAAKIKRD